MRILLVNTYHFWGGGDSTYTLNLANLLRRNDHQIAFFAMQDQRNLADPNADLFVSNIDFREANRRKSLLNGVRVLSRVIYSREARDKFSRLLDRFKPEVVHLQNIHAHITPSVIFEANARGLPVIWTLHDYKLVCPNSHLLNDRTGQICEECGMQQYYQPLLKRCKKGSLLASAMAGLEAYAHRLMRVRDRIECFLTPSAFLRAKLVACGFPSGVVVHLPLFVPDELFGFADSDDGYFLFLGRISVIKGVPTLLQAARLSPQIRVILAGALDTAPADDFSASLPSNCQYVGVKHGEELRGLVRNALAVVIPSVSYENQPFGILEAFASGKPVIASNLGGMAELAVHRERGLLVPPSDPCALADAMLWMLSHSSQVTAMGKSAYEYARVVHSAKSHYANLMEIEHGVVQQERRTSPG